MKEVPTGHFLRQHLQLSRALGQRAISPRVPNPLSTPTELSRLASRFTIPEGDSWKCRKDTYFPREMAANGDREWLRGNPLETFESALWLFDAYIFPLVRYVVNEF